jgi:hypothetical protein
MTKRKSSITFRGDAARQFAKEVLGLQPQVKTKQVVPEKDKKDKEREHKNTDS